MLKPPLNESRRKNWISHETIDHFKTERSMVKLAIVTCLCEYMQSILLKYQLSESQADIKIAGKNIKYLRYIDDNMETNRK